MKRRLMYSVSLLALSAVLITLILPASSHSAPPWTDFDTPKVDKTKKDKGKGNQKGKEPSGKKPKNDTAGDTLLICHRPPANENASDTATQKEIEMVIGKRAWKAHKKHGDSKGGCGILKLTETIQIDDSEGAVKDAAFDRQGNLSLIETEKRIQFYENGEVVKSLEKNGHFRKSISQDKGLYVTLCRGRKFVCSLYDDRGTKVGEMTVGNYTQPGALVGTKMVLTGGGDVGEKAAILDLATGETIWSSPRGNFARFSKETTDYFLLREGGGGNHKLIELRTGNILGEINKNAVMIGISGDNTYIYFATRQKNSKSIEIYDFNLNKVTEWKNLPRVGMYEGSFFENLHKIVIKLHQKGLFVGDYQTLSSDTVPYPLSFFGVEDYHDDQDGLFFISGYTTSQNWPGNDLNILVFDVETKKFIENIIIPFDEIAKDPTSPTKTEKRFVPSIFGFPDKNKVVIQLMEEVRIYEY